MQVLSESKLSWLKAKAKAPESGAILPLLKAKAKAPESGANLASNSEANASCVFSRANRALGNSTKKASLSEAKSICEATLASPMTKKIAFKKAKPKALPMGLLSSLPESLCEIGWI